MKQNPSDMTAESTVSESASYPFTPLEDRPPEAVPGNGRPVSVAPRVSWILTFFTTLLALAVFVPFLAERIQYSITHGRQRAELDVAKVGLATMPLGNLSLACQLVSRRISPSVVHIDVVSQNAATQHTLPFDHPRLGAGSGVIVNSQGFILTNYHVISEALEIQVTLSDDRVVPARVAGTDPATDLALLKIDADGLAAAEWGNSDDLDAGALVWAVGSPFGFRQSITFGIVSAKHREMSDKSRRLKTNYSDFLQTDAAVNPGNSGGPLVDVKGRVVGINTAIVGESFSGASFAIPSSVAKAVYEQLKAEGKIERGWLGVAMQTVDEATVAQFGLAVENGVLVVDFSKQHSPARDAGIRPGDVITRWNGEPVADQVSLVRLVALTPVGDQVEVVVIRGSERIVFKVAVGTRPPESVLGQ